MAGARAAIRYAKAVLSLANDSNTAETVCKDMKLFAKTIAQNKDLSNMLKSPVVGAAIKKSALLEIFKKANALSVNLIDILTANKRLALLESVALEYIKLYDAQRGMQLATVTTAVALTDQLKTKVLAKVKELTGKSAEIENIVDQSIIGGFVLRVGDVQYDASISNKLNQLKREFTLN
ncbi:ATP synthase F1 subunit delta [Gelatiniphilus marinus]|uniref:ATP synthase subunit delta n=1 Tax=Gelatiniphilus marinus TaxID=1759464 RepID=A0ABW5JU32_9FLAO